jgi:rubrerythrin
MAHFMLKFNHGVEIGAYWAYIGHYERTGDPEIFRIAMEEEKHRRKLQRTLEYFGDRPNDTVNQAFMKIGLVIRFLCKYSPLFMLNFVACSMELFAIFSYRRLAKKYPYFRSMFTEMAEAEERHARYFGGKYVYRRNIRQG